MGGWYPPNRFAGRQFRRPVRGLAISANPRRRTDEVRLDGPAQGQLEAGVQDRHRRLHLYQREIRGFHRGLRSDWLPLLGVLGFDHRRQNRAGGAKEKLPNRQPYRNHAGSDRGRERGRGGAQFREPGRAGRGRGGWSAGEASPGGKGEPLRHEGTKKKEEGRRKKEEGRRKKEEGILLCGLCAFVV